METNKDLKRLARELLLAVLPALVAILVYLPSISAGFVFDDVYLIPKNPLVCGERLDLVAIFTSNYWAGSGIADASAYRPIAVATHALACHVAGPLPQWHRILNVLLYALNALIVFVLVGRLFRRLDIAAVCSIAFAVHPLWSEVSLLITSRTDLLAGTATFTLAWLGTILGDPARELRPRALVIASCVVILETIGIFSKENAVCAPILMTLTFAAHRPSSSDWKRFAHIALFPAFTAIALYLIARGLVLGTLYTGPEYSFLDNPVVSAPAMTRIATGIAVLGRYLSLFVLPQSLSFDYSFAQITPVETPVDPWFIFGVCGCIAMVIGALFSLKRIPLVSMGIAWWFASILPVSNIPYPIGTIMAERLSYIPGLGLLVALTSFMIQLWSKLGPSVQRVVSAGLVAVLITIGGMTFMRSSQLSTNCALFEEMVRTAPRSAKAWYGHGICLLEHEESLGAAIAAFHRSLQLWPDYTSAAIQLAQALERAGHEEEAIIVLDDFIENHPHDVRAISAYAMMLGRLGKTDDAIRLLETSIRRLGDDKTLRMSLDRFNVQ